MGKHLLCYHQGHSHETPATRRVLFKHRLRYHHARLLHRHATNNHVSATNEDDDSSTAFITTRDDYLVPNGADLEKLRVHSQQGMPHDDFVHFEVACLQDLALGGHIHSDLRFVDICFGCHQLQDLPLNDHVRFNARSAI